MKCISMVVLKHQTCNLCCNWSHWKILDFRQIVDFAWFCRNEKKRQVPSILPYCIASWDFCLSIVHHLKGTREGMAWKGLPVLHVGSSPNTLIWKMKHESYHMKEKICFQSLKEVKARAMNEVSKQVDWYIDLCIFKFPSTIQLQANLFQPSRVDGH